MRVTIKLRVKKRVGSSSRQDDFPIQLRFPWRFPLGQYRYNHLVSETSRFIDHLQQQHYQSTFRCWPGIDLNPGNRTTVEICTAIIAASIPSLKPLFKAILEGSSALSRRTNKYNRDNDSRAIATKHGENGIEMYDSRHKNTAVASGGRRHFDNESEEMILSDREGIQKTTHVSISIEDPEGCARKTWYLCHWKN